eukprot:4761732-Amphidinium_carterae.1
MAKLMLKHARTLRLMHANACYEQDGGAMNGRHTCWTNVEVSRAIESRTVLSEALSLSWESSTCAIRTTTMAHLKQNIEETLANTSGAGVTYLVCFGVLCLLAHGYPCLYQLQVELGIPCGGHRECKEDGSKHCDPSSNRTCAKLTLRDPQ